MLGRRRREVTLVKDSVSQDTKLLLSPKAFLGVEEFSGASPQGQLAQNPSCPSFLTVASPKFTRMDWGEHHFLPG
jgi:hypothetical protein